MNKETAIGIFGQSIKQNLEGEMRKNSPYIFWPLLCSLYKQRDRQLFTTYKPGIFILSIFSGVANFFYRAN